MLFAVPWAVTSPANPSVIDLVLQAGPVGKATLLVLLVASIVSWGIILERARTFRRARRETQAFLAKFHSGSRLSDLRDQAQKWTRSPVVGLFKAAFHEVSQLSMDASGAGRALDDDAVEDVTRMISRAAAANLRDIERSLTFLATTASTAPFIGLFGTVWGIMTAFQAIGATGASNLAIVAPGIAEALIATAAGLFAAIPAVYFYNHFTHEVKLFAADMDDFALEFLNICERNFT